MNLQVKALQRKRDLFREKNRKQHNPTIPRTITHDHNHDSTALKSWRYQARAKITIFWRGGWEEEGEPKRGQIRLESSWYGVFLTSPLPSIRTPKFRRPQIECRSLLWADVGIRPNFVGLYEREEWRINGEAYGRHTLVSKFKYYSRKKIE